LSKKKESVKKPNRNENKKPRKVNGNDKKKKSLIRKEKRSSRAIFFSSGDGMKVTKAGSSRASKSLFGDDDKVLSSPKSPKADNPLFADQTTTTMATSPKPVANDFAIAEEFKVPSRIGGGEKDREKEEKAPVIVPPAVVASAATVTTESMMFVFQTKFFIRC
jgi:hypothetical protein